MELISFFDYRKKSTVSKAKKGDKEAFLALIDENRLNIYRVARGILKDTVDIEDAIQNTIIKSFQKINSLKQDEYFRTWLIKILINECTQILRKGKRVTYLSENSDTEIYNDSYENIDLTKAINSLSEELRVTTVLFYFEDMSTKDIAKLLKISDGTVRSRLTRARTKLREIMGEVEI
ncbi:MULTISPECIES: RNA polymerase sigma factor [Clostridium]|uniref:RNA polymerase sigma-70 factor (ECF subfamily) n=2 Tax=Clostridium beijerinckii TaxID=1520 RepID=A0A1S8Q372_CLOBE|nr:MULTISPECIES: sigma-70 family RNA polymerase sigma factor [Clostridium]ALB45736.1 sigma-70 family RNA polymerase sigma factor [Clostridium beijerinckii NRRL B-598]AQS05842.1 ECF RNA polymerase sigma factor SigE [Clostridium beijerinckii]MBA2885473.1 RNA polymerase sigma-70 factor (ECF subfamily) [Clostridium beijerinckii]MBA2900026.1 RNA polymerase sigma-70 factor (ECF subfamily) [Clostridium beijerinckii]MBA2909655.1 RNA polymerase sigma-70 factor (ECF subfamily) [Clostridium beijerinckii]